MNISSDDKKYFLKVIAKKVEGIAEIGGKLDENYFLSNNLDELMADNHKLYEDIVGENYSKSFGNPEYAVNILGEDLGHVATYIYAEVHRCIAEVFNNNWTPLERASELIEIVYNLMMSESCEDKDIIAAIKEYGIKYMNDEYEDRIRKTALYTEDDYKKIVSKAGEDIRYLFRYGKYITDNEIKMAQFLSSYEDVQKIAYTMVKGYMTSVERECTNHEIKRAVKISYFVGQELIVRELEKEFGRYNLKLILSSAEATSPNKQYRYDHKFDNALMFDKEVAEAVERAVACALAKYEDSARALSGVAVFESFGEEPFAPVSKSENLRYSKEQAALYQEIMLKIARVKNEYIREEETTFTIIAFPTPEIGPKFEEIYKEIMKINTLDAGKWERIQNDIIKALDKGDFIHIKGKGTNKTDIKVKMHELSNPEKETNFESDAATVNIPVGEVFTSPTLKGTNGLLHLEEVFLNELKYVGLELQFEDGYIKEYTCSNFEDEDKNKKYIEENLLFPNKTLPMGEFAIGTNTFAYVVAQKYNIGSILPILIAEKMGPHFAIGDTCYSFREDQAFYNNFDGKEIVAKDNEKSILRKTDIQNAYTRCHIDITIPYDSLEFINAITKDGETVEVIRDGRFVLDGTEELNEPFNAQI